MGGGGDCGCPKPISGSIKLFTCQRMKTGNGLPSCKPVISESAGSKFSGLVGVMFAAGWLMGSSNTIHYHEAMPHSKQRDHRVLQHQANILEASAAPSSI